MRNGFQKLMREQLQDSFDLFAKLSQRAVPKKGWVRTIREAIGMLCSGRSFRMHPSQYFLNRKAGKRRDN
jgi:hypothetical protein